MAAAKTDSSSLSFHPLLLCLWKKATQEKTDEFVRSLCYQAAFQSKLFTVRTHTRRERWSYIDTYTEGKGQTEINAIFRTRCIYSGGQVYIHWRPSVYTAEARCIYTGGQVYVHRRSGVHTPSSFLQCRVLF